MRQAASAAAGLYYAGVNDQASAEANGLIWWPNNKPNEKNAAGVYDPGTGKFLALKSSQTSGMAYGKGTKTDVGTKFTLGNDRGAYGPTEDYTNAVVMIAIYPDGNNKHIDIYWKSPDGNYIGGKNSDNDPKYSIRISLE